MKVASVASSVENVAPLASVPVNASSLIAPAPLVLLVPLVTLVPVVPIVALPIVEVPAFPMPVLLVSIVMLPVIVLVLPVDVVLPVAVVTPVPAVTPGPIKVPEVVAPSPVSNPLPVAPLLGPAPVPALTAANMPQSSFVAIGCVPRYRLNEGFESGVVTPNFDNPGPTARTNTRRGIVPATTKPTIVGAPGETVVRVETFAMGAAPGISARLKLPVVVSVPATVVYVPDFALSNTSFVVEAGDESVAAREIVAVLGPVTV